MKSATEVTNLRKTYGITVAVDENIQQLARWLPTTQVVFLLQSLWFGHGWDLTALATSTAMLVAGALLANFTFRWE